MVTDQQVRRLFRLMNSEKSVAAAAAKAGMDEKTARKYLKSGRLPSQVKKERTWRTRKDPFDEVWEEVRGLLEVNPGLQGTTLFQHLQRTYPGRFQEGQLRTLQHRIKVWRATEGPPKEVYFPQVHPPGRLCQSDFTHLSDLGITIGGIPFPHLIYHFVLTYSNWEHGTICFSESFESLSEGLQDALWALGAVPEYHQSDRMSAAVHNGRGFTRFTRRYQALLDHYGLQGRRIQAGRAHENGDVEQRHHRFKVALDQALLLRGYRDFGSGSEYRAFLRGLFAQLNAGRKARLREELKVMGRLPSRRLADFKRMDVRVRSSSTIRVYNNVYSVNSRLIGERVRVYLYGDHLDVYYAQRLQERIPRLRGEGRYAVNYRHLIDGLLRKPGAFQHYRYREALFPTHRFRMTYDALQRRRGPRADREYLEILYLAARESESRVDEALRLLLEEERPIHAAAVRAILASGERRSRVDAVRIPAVDLGTYDALLASAEGNA